MLSTNRYTHNTPINFKSQVFITHQMEDQIRDLCNYQMLNENDLYKAEQIINTFDLLNNDGKNDIIEFKNDPKKASGKRQNHCDIFINNKKIAETDEKHWIDELVKISSWNGFTTIDKTQEEKEYYKFPIATLDARIKYTNLITEKLKQILSP